MSARPLIKYLFLFVLSFKICFLIVTIHSGIGNFKGCLAGDVLFQLFEGKVDTHRKRKGLKGKCTYLY